MRAESPFAHFTPLTELSPLRQAITAAWRLPEAEAVAALLPQARLPAPVAEAARALALRLAGTLRARQAEGGRAGLVQGLLQEFSLSSQEGIALMCLAEALLRIPDAATRDALIRDKIGHGDWRGHIGHSPSPFVNAAAWGLLLTGELVATHSEQGLSAALARLLARSGEPLLRVAVDRAMRVMGEQFVTGETMGEALARARVREEQGFRHSYDMLGEAALTMADALRYRADYERAIHAIGRVAAGRGVVEGPGISIKLSALHPRYSRAQAGRVAEELYPVLLHLAQRARGYDIGLNIDAEEADRLELSLDLLERLALEPSLEGWDGLGFVVQAYQKRCPLVVDWLVDLARRAGRRLMVRLVKGAYWDSEIKRAQVDGMEGYPVYTRKAHTDVAYIACARRLLAAPDAVYPQFATHNAQTVAAIHALADPPAYWAGQYEFQCLHGMGEPLYGQVVASDGGGGLGRPCRIYAPVGTHETLLPYLVRRLLENGANTSFVHRIADVGVALDQLVEDPVETVEKAAAQEGATALPHPGLPLPGDLYGAVRANSRGLDLANDADLAELHVALRASAGLVWTSGPLLAEAGGEAGDAGDAREGADGAATRGVLNPAEARDLVGTVSDASLEQVDAALRHALDAAPDWAAAPPAGRAAALERAADLLEAGMPALVGLLVREAGKTCASGVGEVREAVDFLRFYAAQARRELELGNHTPLGPVVCISPWNFPLAIFTGQVAAALAAGNPVLAKPAEQTPLIAAEAVRVLWQAGIPRGALQLLPGPGEVVGAALVADARTQGVMFTGSAEVARLLQQALAGRLGAWGAPVPLVAETGGQNAMIVDSSALAEQVVADVLTSAFDSAGQRCSALRVLCVQEDGADRLVAMLRGAIQELRVGNPDRLATDVGPLIDAEARAAIEAHVAAMQARGRVVHQPVSEALADGERSRGHFVPPTVIEIDSLAELQREVFGPVLHLLRYRRDGLGALLEQINATGYGLTLGLHTRINETVERVAATARVGNLYVNRNMVGAVVGVQPFGGEGLSGTGPKAGGPLYLYRLLARPPDQVLARTMGSGASAAAPTPLELLRAWVMARGDQVRAEVCAVFARQSGYVGVARAPAGPTGESNTYSLHPRGTVLCMAQADGDRLVQLAAILAAGCRAVWPAGAADLHAALPAALRGHITLIYGDALATPFDAVLHHGDARSLLHTCQAVAAWPGPLVCVTGLPPGDTAVPLERLLLERVLSVNTAAAGGNASLMTMA